MADPNSNNEPDEKPKSRAQKPKPLRLTPAQDAGLSELSAEFGASQAQLVRWAVDAMLAKVKASGGRLTLPFRLDDPPLGLQIAEEPPERRPVKYPAAKKGARKKGSE